MNWWKRFPWRRLALAVAVAVAMIVISTPAKGKTMYVGIDSGGDNALLKEDSPWSDGIASLGVNTEVEVDEDSLEEGRGLVKVRVKIRGRMQEGYLKRVVLSEEKVEIDPSTGESLGASSAGTAGRGLNTEIENELREGDPNFDEALQKVEKVEAARNKLLGGSAKKPDATEFREHYRDFGQNGKLIN